MIGHDWQFLETSTNRVGVIYREVCSVCGAIRTVWSVVDRAGDRITLDPRYSAVGLEPRTTDEPLCSPDFGTGLGSSGEAEE